MPTMYMESLSATSLSAAYLDPYDVQLAWTYTGGLPAGWQFVIVVETGASPSGLMLRRAVYQTATFYTYTQATNVADGGGAFQPYLRFMVAALNSTGNVGPFSTIDVRQFTVTPKTLSASSASAATLTAVKTKRLVRLSAMSTSAATMSKHKVSHRLLFPLSKATATLRAAH